MNHSCYFKRVQHLKLMLFSHKTRWRSSLHFNFSRPIHLLAQPIRNSAGMSVCQHRADSSCIPTWFARLSSTVSTISHISAIQMQKIKHKIAHALFPSIVSFCCCCCCCGVLFNLWISMLKSNTPRNVFTIYSSEKPLCTQLCICATIIEMRQIFRLILAIDRLTKHMIL